MGEKSKKRYLRDGGILVFALIAIVGVLLLVFGGLDISKDKDETEAESISLDPEAYSEKIESEVKELCKSVAGDCEVSAVVSLSGGYRSVYATDSQSGSAGYKSSMVLVGSGSSEGAVLICYENPEISGIGVVLSCNGSESMKNSIISLISAAFNVGTNKIHVAFGG